MIRQALPIAIVAFCLAVSGPVRADGEAVYAKQCAVCHQADGTGVPGIYPRLTGQVAGYARIEGGRDYLASVVSYGLAGVIETDGVTFVGVMPAFPGMTSAEVVAVLNHLFVDLAGVGAEGLPSEADVDRVRERKLSPSGVQALRRDLLVRGPGAKGGDEEARASIPAELLARRVTEAREDYARECQGCHRADGLTDPAVIPPLRNFVGYFTHTAEGRAYLGRVPGVAQAALDDARLARLLNWMLATYSPDQMVAGFVPYSAEEVAGLREEILLQVSDVRVERVAELRRAGILRE